MTIESEGSRARRYPYIDVVRFICAASVMLFHFGFVAPVPGYELPASYVIMPWLTLYGQFGVHIFFVISGFVIAISIEGKGFSAFAWARFLRLYPAYWFAVICTTIVLILAGSDRALSWSQVTVNMTMLQSFVNIPDVDGVYHTLAIELRFYLMIILLAMLRLKPTAPAVIGGWLACCLASYMLPSIFGKVVMAAWAPYFLAGMTIKSLIDRSHQPLKIIFLGCAILLEWKIASEHAGRRFAGYNTEIACFVVLAGTLLVWICAVAPNPKRFVPALTTIGGMTYPLYLLHSENGVTFMRWLVPYLPAWLNICLCIGLCILTAYLVSRGPERAIRHWTKAAGERLWANTGRFPKPAMDKI